MSYLTINELLAGMQASGLRTIVITDEEIPTNEELLKAIVEIYKLIHPDTTPPAEEVSDGGLLDMIFQIVERIVKKEIK
jgi:hypothetical protein